MNRDWLEEPYEDPKPSLYECQQPGYVISLNWKTWNDRANVEATPDLAGLTPARRKTVLKERLRMARRLANTWCDRSFECNVGHRCPNKMHVRQKTSIERAGHRMDELVWKRFDCFVEPSEKLTAYRAWKVRRREHDDVRGAGQEARPAGRGGDPVP